MTIPWQMFLKTIAPRRDLNATDKLVYQMIAYRVGNNDHAWPTVRKLAKDTGLHPDTVVACVGRLEAAGLIRVQRPGLLRRKLSNRYFLTNVGGIPTVDAGASEKSGRTERRKTPNDPVLNVGGIPTPTSEGTGQKVKRRVKRRKPTRKRAGEGAKDKSSREPRRDPHADAFKAAFDEVHPDPYTWTKADFVQLARWRKNYPDVTPERFVEVAKTQWSRGQYTPGASLSIKGLCSSWAMLVASAAKVAPADGAEEFQFITKGPNAVPDRDLTNAERRELGYPPAEGAA